jgi:hypothetical protein
MRFLISQNRTHFQKIPTLLVLLMSLTSIANDSIPPNEKNLRLPLTIAGTSTIAGSTLGGLYFLWYADYPSSGMHSFNDWDQYFQMDKAGHTMTTYSVAQVCHKTYHWAGLEDRKSLLVGTAMAMGFQTAIEVMDGFSAEWGFSWGDMGANTLGAGLYAGQHLLWEEQRVRLKFSFSRTIYPAYRPEVFGNGLREEILKDYNGQTYWLSWNPREFNLMQQWPKWLDISFGYGASGMTGGRENIPTTPADDRFIRQRQYYFSFDIDLYDIPAKRNWFRVFRSAVGYIKFPAPTLLINQRTGVEFLPFYF